MTSHPLPALALVRSSRWVRRTAVALLVLLVAAIAAMMLAPWQQTVSGTGSVTTYAPLDRRQTVEAGVKGRILRWGEGIRENARVEKGQTVLEIEGINPELLTVLSGQVSQGQAVVAADRERLATAERGLISTKALIDSYEKQLESYKQVREDVLGSAVELIASAEQKVRAEKESLSAARAALAQAEADYRRKKNLFEDGIKSEREFQEAEQKYAKAQADVQKALAYVESAEREVAAKRRDRAAKDQEYTAAIEEARAKLNKTTADVAKAEGDVEKARSELGKAEKDLLEARSKLAAQTSGQVVTAPRAGFVMSLAAAQGGEVVKEGDPLFVLVPDTPDRAVQIWLDGNDASLVSSGRPVRLQFEGWPAVQFAGWPSVAVGTFGGRVASVDAADDGIGRFRTLIVPDPDDDPWPDDRYLRQGVRANGWVLLSEVKLGMELWRRVNGFPPAVDMPGQKSDKSPGSPVDMGKKK